uniref:G domain-containing protein n=1 Tax=Globisporangium ultimum (strain ATCC 200006 / CBS 805.95 / DAOM BR144) TaxID=431595 RepID=K3WYY6_GLOUD
MATRKTADAVAHGALQRLPYVYTASEIQEMKFWRMTVRESNKIADPIRRSKNQTSRLINTQLSKLSAITRQASLDFPALKRMHPFEREVVVLTLGQGTYEHSIQKLRKVYAALHNIGKQHERACQDVRTKQEALDCGLRCVDELKEIVDKNAPTLRQVAEMAKTLRGLPYVDVKRPIFAFVGAPNVGKSSLVRALSTASPEVSELFNMRRFCLMRLYANSKTWQVANYPFTTRGITMGHIYVEGTTYQIADTPGLIYRPDAKRNAIEKLALAMMEKTKASIGFVFDPTGASGTTVEDQLLLRDELHGRVSEARDDLKWLDIISKVDQPIPELPALQKRLGSTSLAVSAQTNMGLVELGDEIRRMVVFDTQVDDQELQS